MNTTNKEKQISTGCISIIAYTHYLNSERKFFKKKKEKGERGQVVVAEYVEWASEN